MYLMFGIFQGGPEMPNGWTALVENKNPLTAGKINTWLLSNSCGRGRVTPSYIPTFLCAMRMMTTSSPAPGSDEGQRSGQRQQARCLDLRRCPSDIHPPVLFLSGLPPTPLRSRGTLVHGRLTVNSLLRLPGQPIIP